MSGGSVRYVVRFVGRVQGVCFRATAVSLSQGLNVHGFVRNEPDGSVRMDVQGPAADVKRLIGLIESEMSGNIDDTQIDERPSLDRGGGFTIQY